MVFFRPTPLSFRQVFQHVRLHVAEISELINYIETLTLAMGAHAARGFVQAGLGLRSADSQFFSTFAACFAAFLALSLSSFLELTEQRLSIFAGQI